MLLSALDLWTTLESRIVDCELDATRSSVAFRERLKLPRHPVAIGSEFRNHGPSVIQCDHDGFCLHVSCHKQRGFTERASEVRLVHARNRLRVPPLAHERDAGAGLDDEAPLFAET
jgi:hypothetical protein